MEELGIKIICARVDKSKIGVYRGKVVSIIPKSAFEGNAVVIIGGDFSRVYISDIDMTHSVVDKLMSGEKVLSIPPTESHIYQELLTKGFYEGLYAELTEYIIDANS